MLHHGGRQGYRRFNHLGAGLLSLVLLVLPLSGCTHHAAPRPQPHGVTVGGPIQQVDPFTFGAIRPQGQFRDVYVAQLINSSHHPVVLDEVRLQADKKASGLRFGGAYVAPAGSNLHVASGHDERLQPLQGYRLAGHTGNLPPVLVLRVGPALPGHTQGLPISRNNDVNLWYHSLNGKRYVIAFPVQVEYPNKPTGP